MQSSILLLGVLASAICASPVDQQPLADPHAVVEESNESHLSPIKASTTGLHGRFLHITDFHPDRYYKYGSSLTDDESCHNGKGDAGYFGSEGTECDSPYSLINETFRWLEQNLKDDIDFVIWTGDSARHDNDEQIPRTPQEIQELNEFMAEKWVDLFGTRKNDERISGSPQVSVPVVPTFGNNDIAPHNIFMDGPNVWTKRYAEIWRHFIPEEQRHSFVEGGWFTSELIPGKLAAISLNTMYFFDSNSAVDGCADKSEPGYEHMEWLRVQLEILRSRNMKAILIGHVPPAHTEEKNLWDETCWQKYTLWTSRYRDVIVGSAYGHMNVDHFMIQDSHDVDFDFLVDKTTSDRISIESKADYINSLREQWADLPSPPRGIFDEEIPSSSPKVDANKKKGKEDKKKKEEKKRQKFLEKIEGPWAERYSVSLVSPSLVPNYFPTLRVVEYNITGLENSITSDFMTTTTESLPKSDLRRDSSPNAQKKKKEKKEQRKPDFKVPDAPSSTSPPGPAYSNQPLSWLKYTQYYANLTKLNEEYDADAEKTSHINFEVEYSTDDDIYQMKDLTVRSFFQLAARIGKEGEAKSAKDSASISKKVNQAWSAFLTRAFVGFFDVNDLNVDTE
ncbi:Endopolyphosphatase Ppn1p-related protein [Penicillium angulare]|uniref:Endopolyphosphatase n=1 Tax=Penicillium angulare TaxID=116970 RepID=A0A9W9K8G0_9EURO|nr:Endopolyphosphatase Ppn1p-related protein [Penicillium angulare]